MFKIFEVFQKGKELTHAATWKNAGVAVTVLAPVLGYVVYLLKMFIDIQITDDQITTISLGIVVVVNLFLPYATSSKVGLPNKENE